MRLVNHTRGLLNYLNDKSLNTKLVRVPIFVDDAMLIIDIELIFYHPVDKEQLLLRFSCLMGC